MEIPVAVEARGMKYQIAQLSSSGARRANEDRVGIAERPNAVLLAVADGLGGHTGGELASQTVVETVMRLFHAVKQVQLADPFAFLALSMLKAHRAIGARAQAHSPPLEARTTCVLCLVQEGYAYWAHIGDSRLYHFRGERLLKRTEDHTTIEELRRDGIISEEEMAQHPRKNALLRTLGGNRDPRISLGEEALLKTGDTLLLCSDGLWEALTTEEIGRMLALPKLDDGIEELVSTAEKRKGESCDNVTVACLRWEDRAAISLPLHGPSAPRQIDTQRLLKQAVTNKAAARRTETEPAPQGQDRRDSIETSINELEEYLRRFESKR
ncbi:MAG: PP2C family protein-serine/threonine phosphatase [Sulfurifustaceae bacterium]